MKAKEVKKYRKKPIVIEAYQTEEELQIETLEGTMKASPGDYIVTGVEGEQYPVKKEIFEKTYEDADVKHKPDLYLVWQKREYGLRACKKLIEEVKESGIDKENEKKLRQLLLSGIVFEDLKNEMMDNEQRYNLLCIR